MAELIDLAVTAAGNTARFPENMQFRAVNDAARELEAMIARELRDRNMSIAASGSSNAFAITTSQTITSYTDNLLVGFTANHTITGAATLAVNGMPAKSITAQDGSALGRNDIVSGQKVLVVYKTSTGAFQIVGGRVAGSSADILARIVKAGMVMAWPIGTAPTGWLECNGAAISRTTYAELFAAIGTTYGVGDGSTTFNLPDYRGEFLRGFANGSSNDPDRSTRTNRGDGTTGDAVGTKQSGETAAHTHTATLTASVTGATSTAGDHTHSYVASFADNQSVGSSGIVVNKGTFASTTGAAGSHSHTVSAAGSATGTTNASGGNETRPRNVNVMWIILANPAQASAATLGLAGFSYSFDTGTTDADPGAGKMRFNSATLASVTAIYVSETDGYGAPLGPALQAIPVNSNLYIYKVGDPSTYAFFTMGTAVTDAGTYDKIVSLTYVGSNGSFSANDPLGVIPMRAGATGPSGSDGGIRWTFDSSTTMADPGTGDFRLDSATYASVSALAISARTAEATNPDHSDWVTTWDDSTTTTDRGQITLRNALGTARVVLSVNGNITDNGTWLQVPVAHVSSDGTLSGTVFVSFSRSGNAGAGSGDVSAAANFATDNRLLRSDGTLKGAQASAITVDDSGNMSGVGTIATGNATITGTLGTSGVATIGTTAATAVKVDPSGFVEFPEISAPSTPASGFTRAYAKSDGKIYRKDDAGTETELGGASAGASHGRCRLTKSGSNLLLSRYDGKALIINGTVQDIPSGGVTLAPTSLSINTLYYIYAYMSAGTMTLEASATVPAADSATGVQIKNGDATRTLVGQARTITGPAWVDTAAQRFVLSYFNRLPIYAINALTSNFSTTSTSYVEAMPSNRAEFLTWADQMCEVKVATYNFNSGLGYCFTKASFDGATSAYALTSYGSNGYPCTAVHQELLSAGYHYGTGMVKVDTGTGTWQGNTSFSQTTVSVMTMG